MKKRPLASTPEKPATLTQYSPVSGSMNRPAEGEPMASEALVVAGHKAASIAVMLFMGAFVSAPG